MSTDNHQSFFALTPEHVLEAVEQSGARTTGLCYPLNSFENRVYEVELEDGRRLVAKFYRPGRWERATIADEHKLLLALRDAEIPVCAPTPFDDGDTIAVSQDDIFFALYPRTGGRCPDELSLDQLTTLGRLLARIHNVSAALDLQHRPHLTPQTYGLQDLQTLHATGLLPLSVERSYDEAVKTFAALATPLFAGLETFVVHGDCHKGNLLHGSNGWFFLDFDDMAVGPAVQDFWLLLPARPQDCPQDVAALVEGYEQFRTFPRHSLALIEALRGLRYIHYAAWVANRWKDPAFPRAFTEWGTESYWQRQLTDLCDQIQLLQTPRET